MIRLHHLRPASGADDRTRGAADPHPRGAGVIRLPAARRPGSAGERRVGAAGAVRIAQRALGVVIELDRAIRAGTGAGWPSPRPCWPPRSPSRPGGPGRAGWPTSTARPRPAPCRLMLAPGATIGAGTTKPPCAGGRFDRRLGDAALAAAADTRLSPAQLRAADKLSTRGLEPTVAAELDTPEAAAAGEVAGWWRCRAPRAPPAVRPLTPMGIAAVERRRRF